MEITEQKAETINKLKGLIRDNNDDLFTKVTREEKTLYLAYTSMSCFLSLLIEGPNKTYAFIKESLIEEEREKELNLLFEDRELHHFSKNEVDNINKLTEQQERKKLSFKSINYDDVNTIMKTATLREYRTIFEFTEQLNKFLNREHDGVWNDNTKLLCMFKLGVMQGKREERSGRKASRVIGGAM